MGSPSGIIDLSDHHRVTDSVHWTAPINQNYHPSGCFPQESFEIVYSSGNLNCSKFVPIVLKEWFFLVKLNGYMVIDYKPNSACDWRDLEKNMNWLWEKGYEILFHGWVEKGSSFGMSSEKLTKFIQAHETEPGANLNKRAPPIPSLSIDMGSPSGDRALRFICKKIKSTLVKEDSIDKWTFGIVSNGKRSDWLEKIIASISKQSIPNYEVIVCGPSPSPVLQHPRLSYIPFRQRDDLGWITYKKNLIVDRARYENICVIHDRILFPEGWFEGMKKWGNSFDHLSCRVEFNGRRDDSDWPCMDSIFKWKGKNLFFTLSLDYRDWHKDGFVGGTIHIGKKSLFMKYPWPIHVYWNEGEDFLLSKKLSDHGHIPRLNVHSKVVALSARFSILNQIKYSPQIPWKKLDRISLKRVMLRGVSNMFKIFGGDIPQGL